MDWKDLSKLTKLWKNVSRGAGSILEIQPTDDEEPRLYHPARTDLDALRGDWNRIGDDLRRALDDFSRDWNKMVDRDTPCDDWNRLALDDFRRDLNKMIDDKKAE